MRNPTLIFPKSILQSASRTFQKVISLKATTKVSSTTTVAAAGICKFADDDYDSKDHHNRKESKTTADDKVKRSDVLEALLAKMFAEVTSIKAPTPSSRWLRILIASRQSSPRPRCGCGAEDALPPETELRQGRARPDLAAGDGDARQDSGVA
ncbi:hypothetical protein LINPERPRIM_LOCUS27934 [Linum perenne]